MTTSTTLTIANILFIIVGWFVTNIMWFVCVAANSIAITQCRIASTVGVGFFKKMTVLLVANVNV